MAGRMKWRAAFVVGAAWGAMWAVTTPLFLALLPLLWRRYPIPLLADMPLAAWLVAALVMGSLGMAIRGTLTGAAFALLLSRVERGRTVDELSTGRLVLWANLIGLLWTAFNVGVVAVVSPPEAPAVWWLVAVSGISHALLVTVCALVTVWLVRRGAAAAPEPLGALPAEDVTAAWAPEARQHTT